MCTDTIPVLAYVKIELFFADICYYQRINPKPITDMAKKIAEQLIDTLAESGVERIYAVTGDSLNEVNEAVRKNNKIKWIHVRHEETVVPRRGLGIVAPRGELLERLRPVAVRPTAAEETGRSVEDIGVVERPLRILPGDVVPAHGPGHAGDRPVVVSIFQRAGDRLALDIGRYKPLCHIVIGTFLIDVRRADHRIERLFGIVSADTFQVGVGNDRRDRKSVV